MKINDNALKYILLQRTELLVISNKKIYKNFLKLYSRLFKKDILDVMINFEIAFRKKGLKDDYVKRMYGEFLSFKDFIPAEIGNFMDIGCGIAVINLFISEKLNGKFGKLFLVDKTEMEKSIHYGYQDTASFYNSLDLAKETLTDNGFDANKLEVIEPAGNTINLKEKIDMVISVIAWGFHFPVNAYLQEVHESLNENGCLIIDIRKGTNGTEELKSVFREVTLIAEYEKYERVFCRK